MSSPFEVTPAGPDAPLQFPCASCGATLHFAPGLDALRCPYCGAENAIPEADASVREEALTELDYRAYLARLRDGEQTHEVVLVKCTSCGAETTFDPNITSDACAFCGTPLVSQGRAERLIRPGALLPFKIDPEAAHTLFRTWIGGLWFAPNNLKQAAHRQEKLAGMYIPHWTFDAGTSTAWRGQRGEHYYVTETYRENGQTRTRQVRHTRWHDVSGRLDHAFDDVLVCATDSLPRQYMTSLEPWDLRELVPYGEAYLSGFRTERYSVGLEDGWEHARTRIDGEIDTLIRQRIGGDEQRIVSKDTRYHDLTFKHVLLPVWLSAYRYGDRVFRFIVNARTGEVQGERPWSWVKITLAVLLALLVLALVLYLGRDA